MKRTEINLTVLTDYTHPETDTIERVRQEIETASFHLQTLFHFIKRSATAFTEPEKTEEFCGDLINFADLGEGLALSIWKSISDLQTTGESETLESLAAQISKILKNPLLPERLYNVLTDELAVVEIDTDSPENILLNLRLQTKAQKTREASDE